MHLLHGPRFANKRFYSGLIYASFPKGNTSLNCTEADLGAGSSGALRGWDCALPAHPNSYSVHSHSVQWG